MLYRSKCFLDCLLDARKVGLYVRRVTTGKLYKDTR